MDSLQHLNWKQGLFLKPQHFQQFSPQFCRSCILFGCSTVGNGAGLYHFSYDKQALASGVLTVLKCTVIMPDGTLLKYLKLCVALYCIESV